MGNRFHENTHPILLETLKAAPQPLFPNLLSLKWPLPSSSHDDQGFLETFLSSRLSHLIFDSSNTGLAIATLQMVPRAPVQASLRTFKFRLTRNSDESYADILPAYRAFLRSVEYLEELDTCVHDHDTYIDIARLPNLWRLSADITTRLPCPSDLLSTVQSPFPRLQRLCLRINTVDLTLFSCFLQLARFDHLARISMEIPPFSKFMTSHRDPGEDFPGLVSTIAKQCSSEQLRRVRIVALLTGAFYNMFEEHPTIKPQDIAPLFKFKRMENFSLNVDWKLDFDNATLETIVSSWPHLCCLSLAPRCNSRPPRMTLKGLQVLRVCPNLDWFGSSFVDDVSSPDSYESIDKDNLPIIPSISSLDVGISEPTNYQNMAQYLAALFPNLRHIQYESGAPITYVPNPKWDGVKFLLNGGLEDADVIR